MSDVLRSLRRSNRALRRVWRRRRRELKRRTCAECGYPARMHIDERSNHGWDYPAWRLVDPQHYFVEVES